MASYHRINSKRRTQPPSSPNLTSFTFFSESTKKNSRWTSTHRWNVTL